MAIQTAPNSDKKRVDGPVKISYVDASGKDHDRVPADVKSVKVLDRKANKAKVYGLDKLGASIVAQLAAQGLGKRVDITARNAVKADAAASVINVADELFTNLIEGKFTTRGEGKGGPGRTFDVDMWVTIFKNAYNVKRKSNTKLPAWSEKQDGALATKLMSMDGKSRNKYLNEKQSQDPVLKLERMNYQTAQLKEAAKSGGKNEDAFADLF